MLNLSQGPFARSSFSPLWYRVQRVPHLELFRTSIVVSLVRILHVGNCGVPCNPFKFILCCSLILSIYLPFMIGSVVGIVGSGGNIGAAVFSIFFVQFSYRAAFLLMGLSAVGSSFLCLFMKTENLAHTYSAVTPEMGTHVEYPGSDAIASESSLIKSAEDLAKPQEL